MSGLKGGQADLRKGQRGCVGRTKQRICPECAAGDLCFFVLSLQRGWKPFKAKEVITPLPCSEKVGNPRAVHGAEVTRQVLPGQLLAGNLISRGRARGAGSAEPRRGSSPARVPRKLEDAGRPLAQSDFCSFSQPVSQGSMAGTRLGAEQTRKLPLPSADTSERAARGVFCNPSVHPDEQTNGAPSTKWNPRLDAHESQQALGDGEGQGSLACCSPGVAKSRTRLSD